MDCRRSSKNFGYMSRCLHRCKDDQEILTAGKAVIEHHFDCHTFCGGWCPRKGKSEEWLKQTGKFYRCKNKEPKLYAKLQSIVARFSTLEALKELYHKMDTCANESFNNTIAWMAPKTKFSVGLILSRTGSPLLLVSLHLVYLSTTPSSSWNWEYQ